MSEKHYRVEYPSQQETVMTIKLTEKLLNQLKNASSSSITISFHKGKAVKSDLSKFTLSYSSDMKLDSRVR